MGFYFSLCRKKGRRKKHVEMVAEYKPLEKQLNSPNGIAK